MASTKVEVGAAAVLSPAQQDGHRSGGLGGCDGFLPAYAMPLQKEKLIPISNNIVAIRLIPDYLPGNVVIIYLLEVLFQPELSPAAVSPDPFLIIETS